MARLLAAARWFADRGVRLKGHPLVWHTVKAAWLDAVPPADVEDVVPQARAAGGHRVRRAHRGVGCDQRGRHHAGVRQRAGRRDECGDRPVAADRPLRDAAARLRRSPHLEPVRDAPHQRLRPRRRVRRAHRGRARARRPHRRDRPADPHAPGLPRRGRAARAVRPVRALRAAAPLHGDLARVRRAHAGGHRRPQRLPRRVLAVDAGRRGRARPTSSSATTGRSPRIRRSRRSPTGASPISAHGSELRSASSAPTDHGSPGTTPSTASSAASGGCRRRRCAPTPRGA